MKNELRIAFGHSPYSNVIVPERITFEELAVKLSLCKQGEKRERYFLRGGNLIKPKTIFDKKLDKEVKNKEYRRNNKYLNTAEIIVIDGDESNNGKRLIRPILLHKILKKLGYNHIIYTSHSHGKDKMKFRVVLQCKMISEEYLKPTNHKLIDELNSHGANIQLANEMNTWSQPWFYGTRDNPDDGLFKFYEYHEGAEYKAVNEYKGITHATKKNPTEKGKLGEGGHFYEQLRSDIMSELNFDKERVLNKGFDDAYQRMMTFIHGRCTEEGVSIEDYPKKKNLFKTIEDGINKILGENEDEKSPAPAVIVSSKKKKNIKKNPFPNLILPEPLQLQHEQFKNQIPKPFMPELLYPFETSFSTMLLGNKILTPLMGRTLSRIKFPIGASTIGKDNHSTNILHQLGKQEFKGGSIGEEIIVKMLKDINLSPASVESEGALKEIMETHAKFGYFWIYTEGSSNLGKIADSQSRYVKAISSSLIDIYDGVLLKGSKNKGSKGNTNSIPSLDYPFCVLTWYTQPEVFFPNMTTEMLGQGFAGRGDYNFIEKVKTKNKNGSIFGNTSGLKPFTPPDFNKEYLKYITFVASKISSLKNKIQLPNTGLEIIGDWEEENLLNNNARDDENLQKFISRIPMSAEKELCSQAVHEHLWRCFKKKKEPFKKEIIISKKLQENMIPWMEHQLYVRENIVFERIGESVNKRREDALHEIMANLRVGILSYPNAGENAIGMAKLGYAPMGYLGQKLRDRGTLGYRNAGETNRFLIDLEREGKLMKESVMGREYFGYRK